MAYREITMIEIKEVTTTIGQRFRRSASRRSSGSIRRPYGSSTVDAVNLSSTISPTNVLEGFRTTPRACDRVHSSSADAD